MYSDLEEFAKRIKEVRTRLGWSLAEVSRRTGLSRAYINSLELGRGKRPGAEALRRLEDVLGPLIGKPPDSSAVPPGLRTVARERQIPESEVRMLATLKVRGVQPRTEQRWRFIYDALVTSEAMDTLRRKNTDS
jgi:transcriptional regulator with XRE-family HTH domain